MQEVALHQFVAFSVSPTVLALSPGSHASSNFILRPKIIIQNASGVHQSLLTCFTVIHSTAISQRSLHSLVRHALHHLPLLQLHKAFTAMPRLLSCSVDDTTCYTVTQNDVYAFNASPSHTVSATDLRYLAKLEHVLAKTRKQQDFQHDLRAALSTPRARINYNARRSASFSDTSGVLESFPSANASSRNDCHVLEPSTGAHPLRPAFESGGYASSDGESLSPHDADLLPFPLNPSPISAHICPAVTDAMALPRTPSRRWPSGRHYWTSPSSPDRYISNRQKPQEASKTFRVSKSPHQLCSSERLLRHPSATPDPFGPLVVSRTRDHRTAASVVGDAHVQRSRPGTMGFTNLLTLPQDTLVLQNRQVSAGAVWNVGGSNAATHSGPIRSISDGRGGFLSSGSNAPMHTSHFYDEDILDHGLARMESRLAAALDIDLTSRVIDTSRAVRPTRSVSVNVAGVKRKSVHSEPRIRWKHGEWTQGAFQSRMSLCFPLDCVTAALDSVVIGRVLTCHRAAAKKMRKTEPRAVPTIPFR